MDAAFPELHSIRSLLRTTGSVLTVGTFDGVHQGHRAILEQVCATAQAEGCPSVLITFHPHPRAVVNGGGRLELLTPIEERVVLLKSFGIDEVVVVPFTPAFAALSPEAYIRDFLVQTFAPKVIVTGYDHRFGSGRQGTFETLDRMAATYQYRVAEIPATMLDEAAISSTKIRKALQAGQVEEAAQMLGRPYAVSGTVATGKQLGRTIGFPTANLVPLEADQLIPAEGVYACWASGDGFRNRAMVNIGRRPTVEAAGMRTIEANLLDGFSGDLYNQPLTLQFVARLRDEQKFGSLDALKAQLQRDQMQAVTSLK